MHEIAGKSVIALALSPQLDGQVLAARAHVTYCQTCARALADSVNRMLAEPEVEKGPFWSWTDAKTLLIQFTEQALRVFQHPQQPALALRSHPEMVYHYTIEDEAVGFGVEIEIDRAEEAETCTIALIISRSNEQAAEKLVGASVILIWDETETRRQNTDTFGEVVFEAIPFEALSTLSLEIAPPA